MGCGVADEVVPIPAGGSGKPAATSPLLTAQPLEAFRNGRVIGRKATISQSEDAESGGIGVTGEIRDNIVWTFPLGVTQVDQTPAAVSALGGEQFGLP